MNGRRSVGGGRRSRRRVHVLLVRRILIRKQLVELRFGNASFAAVSRVADAQHLLVRLVHEDLVKITADRGNASGNEVGEELCAVIYFVINDRDGVMRRFGLDICNKFGEVVGRHGIQAKHRLLFLNRFYCRYDQAGIIKTQHISKHRIVEHRFNRIGVDWLNLLSNKAHMRLTAIIARETVPIIINRPKSHYIG